MCSHVIDVVILYIDMFGFAMILGVLSIRKRCCAITLNCHEIIANGSSSSPHTFYFSILLGNLHNS